MCLKKDLFSRHLALKQVVLAGTFVIAAVLIPFHKSKGAEPVAEFITGLRHRNMHDMVRIYLDNLKADPTLPPEFRQALPFEEGITLVAQALTEKDMRSRKDKLAKALAFFQKFFKANPEHSRKLEAKKQNASIQLYLARILVWQAGRVEGKKLKAEHLKQAQHYYHLAAASYKDVLADLKTELQSPEWQLKPEDPRYHELSVKQTTYVRQQLYGAAILEELAGTTFGLKQRQRYLKKAVAAYDSVYRKYNYMYYGLLAHYRSSKCLLRLGKYEKAIKYIDTILLEEGSDHKGMREIHTQAITTILPLLFGENHEIDEKLLKKKRLELLGKVRRWCDGMLPTEQADKNWLIMRHAFVRGLKWWTQNCDVPTLLPQIKESIDEQAVFVKPFYPEVDRQNLLMVLQIFGEVRKDQSPLRDTVTFADAYAAAQKKFAWIERCNIRVRAFKSREESHFEECRSELLTKERMEKVIREGLASLEALSAINHAIELAGPSTSRKQLNTLRTYLCDIYFSKGEILKAAAAGESVIQHYPRTAEAKQCATLSLAGYQHLYGEIVQDRRKAASSYSAPRKESLTEKAEFEIRHIIRLSQYYISHWPNDRDTAEAILLLARFLVLHGQPGKEEESVATLKKVQPRKLPASELRRMKEMYHRLSVTMHERIRKIPEQQWCTITDAMGTMLHWIAFNASGAEAHLWIASDYQWLGQTRDTETRIASPAAAQYYAGAVRSYQAILASTDEKEPLKRLHCMHCRAELAYLLERLGRYEEALCEWQKLHQWHKTVTYREKVKKLRIMLGKEDASVTQQPDSQENESGQKFIDAQLDRLFERQHEKNRLKGWPKEADPDCSGRPPDGGRDIPVLTFFRGGADEIEKVFNNEQNAPACIALRESIL